MNPELPNNPREELELQVTALLLGELNDAEAAAVREVIAKDPELQKFHDDFKQTIDLVREATVTEGAPETEPAEPLTLSDARRKILRVAFTLPPMKPGHRAPRRVANRLIAALAVLSLMAVLGSLLLPSLAKSKAKAQRITVLNNMRQLELAKQMWADENQKPAGTAPTMDELKPYLGGRGLPPIAGERYVVGKVGEAVTAEVDAEAAKLTFGRLPARPADSDADTSTVVMSSDGKLGYVDSDQSTGQRIQVSKGLDIAVTVAGGSHPATPAATAIVLPNTTSLGVEPENLGQFAHTPTSEGEGISPTTGASGQINANSLGEGVPQPAAKPWDTGPNVRGFYDDAYAVTSAQNREKAPAQTLSAEAESIQLKFANASKVGAAIDSLGDGDGRGKAQVDAINNRITLAAGDQEGAELLAKLDTQSKQQLIEQDVIGASDRRGGQGGGGGGSGDQPSLGRFYRTEGAAEPVTELVTVDGKRYAKEFLGYDDPGSFVPQAQTGSADVPITASLPQATYRLKAIEDSSGAAPGTPAPDRALGEKRSVPVVGDVPTLGHLFRSGETSPPATAAPSTRPDVVRTADSDFSALAGNDTDHYFARGTVVNGGTFDVNGTLSDDAFVEANRKPGEATASVRSTDGTFTDHLRGASSLATTAPTTDKTSGFEWHLGNVVITDNETTRRQLEKGMATGGAVDAPPAPDVKVAAKFKEVNDAHWAGTLEQPTDSKQTKDAFASRYSYGAEPASGPQGHGTAGGNIVLPPTGAAIPAAVSDQLITAGLRNNPNVPTKPSWPARTPTQQHTSELIQEGKLLLEQGRTDEAKAKLEVALKAEPGNYAAAYYSSLIKEQQQQQQAGETLKREVALKSEADQALKVPATPPELNLAARTSTREGQATGQAYWAKKRELDTLLAFQEVLDTRVNSLTVDKALPRSEMVTVIDRAVPETNSGFLGGMGHALGKDYQATARIKVDRRSTDIQEFGSNRTATYDPYFIQTEAEAMKSDRVLSNVVNNLNLNKVWAKGEKNLTTAQSVEKLRRDLEVKQVPNTAFVAIKAKSSNPEEAATLANAVAEGYRTYRLREQLSADAAGIKVLKAQFDTNLQQIDKANQELAELRKKGNISDAEAAGMAIQADLDTPLPRTPSTNAPIPQPEIQTSENNFSTFSLNVSDVSFKLAAASLEKGQMPEAASIRSEEFINAFDYRDPEPIAPLQGGDRGGFAPIAFNWERARYPFAHNRDLLRFSLKTAAAGRQAGRPLNVVLLLDNSGSMERADRVQIIREALRVLASQLQPQDKLSVITFARTPRLIADGISGDRAAEVAGQVGGLTPEGGTNLEDAMNLAYQTALRHYLANGINRLVVLTDGAANLGNVEPESLKQQVEANRKQGIALDCFGIGWEGYNDDLLEVLARNGDGRYGFINTPAEAATDFAGQLAGALKVAASDVKVQVEFNAARVTSYRQIGYAKHQLKKEQFRDNTVDAAEIAAQEAGNALYAVEVNPDGSGPLATVRVRYKVPGTTEYREQAWDVPYNGSAVALDQSSPAMRLASTASAFAEWLVVSPYAGEVTPDALLGNLSGVPEVFGADPRPKKLEWMIRQAKSLTGK
jgi:Mg-chelatase subunit ChlD/type II secretory pathway pseudopilin PulG/tetratricopeptide (TPR) repeat protein